MPNQKSKPGAPHPAKNADAPSTSTTTEGGTSPQDTISTALRAEWAGIVAVMDSCPDAFAAFVADAHRHIAADEHWQFGSGTLRDFVGNSYVASDGSTFALNHSHDAVFIRELCRRHPDLAPHVRTRASKFDAIYSQPRHIISDDYIAALADANTRKGA